MKISNIAHSVQTQQVNKKGRKSEAKPVKQGSDKVEISSKARQLATSNNIAAAASKTVKDVPDVREDRIAEVRERINQGFYNQENIASALADRLLKEFGI